MSGTHNPPKWPDKFLAWFCSEDQVEILQGDLYELYHHRLQQKGPRWAGWYFTKDVFDMLRPFAFRKRSKQSAHNHFPMFKNHIKIAYRNFKRQSIYSSINVSGLAIGLACFMLIFLYIRDELSYDRMHSKQDRIYRLVEHFESEGVGEHSASQPFPVAPTLMNDFPGQVQAAVRFFNFQSPSLALANMENDREFNESRVFFVDSTFFDVFDFQLVQGNKNTALDEPNSILITQSMSRKYFGDLDPMGKILRFQGTQNYLVTGVIEDVPLNTHFQFDFLISFSSLKNSFNGSYPGSWYWNPCWTYLLLNENNDTETLTAQFPDFVKKYFPEVIVDDVTLELQPLTDIHLRSKLDYEIQANSDENNIYIFSAIAVLVLFIAGINFINLSTARSTKRAKEVGVRKVLGSQRRQLMVQFMVESLLLTAISVIVAIVLVALVMPSFNALTEKNISLFELVQPTFLLGTLMLTLLVGGIAGFYPSVVLSSFKTVKALKNTPMKTRGLGFRKVLVVAQFVISMVLITGTIIALDQLKMLQNNDLGFNKEQVLMVPVIRTPMAKHYPAFKEEVLREPGILSVTCVEEIVGAKHQVGNYKFEGMDRSMPFPRLFVRHDFIETMGIQLLEGRSYAEHIVTDDSLALIVNETLVRQMGWSSNADALGKSFGQRGRKIVGVVKDFNFMSKHHAISPLVLDLDTRSGAFNLFIKYMAVRVDNRNIGKVLDVMRHTWKGLMPDRPFDYFFLEDKLTHSYQSEVRLSKVTNVFSLLAIMVACLGLFGLATFTTEQRTKEIGIRKVLGIKASEIILLLTSDFALLIFIAFGIAVPLAYPLINMWLEGFAYRVSIEPWPFLVAGLLTFAVAAITVGYHSFKASIMNPVDSLKYE